MALNEDDPLVGRLYGLAWEQAMERLPEPARQAARQRFNKAKEAYDRKRDRYDFDTL
ncbi:hypothetical protein [Streptomyces sp. NPDC054797]